MGDIEKKAKDEVANLGEQLKKMPFNMRMFSLAMRSLYAENAVGTKAALAVQFRKLRDDTKRDAMVYLKGILPIATHFVSSISEYFEYYAALDYEQWCGQLSNILKETTGYKQLCSTLLTMHKEILVPLKKREDQAKILVTEFKDLQEKFEEQEKALEEAAHEKSFWAGFLCWIPFVGEIAYPLLEASGNADLARAAASHKQADIFGSASITVSKTLIPAIEHFIEGVSKAAGFFSVMEQELMQFEGQADEAQNNPIMLHYLVMKKEASDMKSNCEMFYAVLPDVRTDFEAIPTEGTDQNYVDRWLAKEEKMIAENLKKAPKLAQMVMKSIKG